MKKVREYIKWITVVIIAIVLTSGISVYATYNYFASDIKYTNNKTVADALNDLYYNKKETSDEYIEITRNGEQILNKYYKNLNLNVQPFIWLNESNSSVDAQTIQCDMSKYKNAIIFIEYNNQGQYTGKTKIYQYNIVIGETKTLSVNNFDNTYIANRTIRFKSDGIEISNGQYSGNTTGSGIYYGIIDGIILY